MKLWRTAATSSTYHCARSEESGIRNREHGVIVDFKDVGNGLIRQSQFGVTIEFKDILHILDKMYHIEGARDLHNCAYQRGYYNPRYPMPTTISHWCAVLMIEVRKEGYL